MTTDHEEAIEIALMRAEIDALKVAVEAQSKQVAELVTAWNTATSVLAMIKFLSVVGAGVVGVIAYFKGVR